MTRPPFPDRIHGRLQEELAAMFPAITPANIKVACDYVERRRRELRKSWPQQGLEVLPLTMVDRVEAYRMAFGERWPSSVPHIVVEDGRHVLQGVWMFGQDFRNKSEYYGAYPGNYLDRLQALFPDHPIMPNMLPLGRGRVLHAFSGSLGPGPYDRCDINQPAEHQCDVVQLPDGLDYSLVVADTPYSKADSKKYKSPPPNRRDTLRALARVTVPDGLLCWLDTQWPIHSKKRWTTVGRIYIQRSTNHRIRLLSIFHRTAEAQ